MYFTILTGLVDSLLEGKSKFSSSSRGRIFKQPENSISQNLRKKIRKWKEIHKENQIRELTFSDAANDASSGIKAVQIAVRFLLQTRILHRGEFGPSHGRRFTEFGSGFPPDPGGLEEKQSSGWEEDQEHPVPHEFPDEPASQLAAIGAVAGLLALLADLGSRAAEVVGVVFGDGYRNAVVFEHRR